MSLLKGKYIESGTITQDKVDLTGNFTWTGDHSFTSGSLVVPTPSGDTEAASKGYVDSVAAGLKWKDPVRVRAQGNIDLSAPGATIDGVTMSVDQRFCADQQTTTTQDGLYLWKGAATPAVRTSDAAAGSDFASAALLVQEGTDAEKCFVCSNNVGSAVIGTDDLTMVNAFGAVGAHLMGGSSHTADTLANLNTKVSDATLVGKGNANTWTAKQTFTPSTGAVAAEFNGADRADGDGYDAITANGGDSTQAEGVNYGGYGVNATGGAVTIGYGGSAIKATGGSGGTLGGGTAIEAFGSAASGNAAGGTAIYATTVDGGDGILVVAGNANAGKSIANGGNGITSTGGNATTGEGGKGASLTSGTGGTTGSGGMGLSVTAGAGGSTSGAGGQGGSIQAGSATSGSGGLGLNVNGGAGGGNGVGGGGITVIAGTGAGTGAGGVGFDVTGGEAGATANGGDGISVLGGSGGATSGNGANGITSEGGNADGGGTGGHGIDATGGVGSDDISGYGGKFTGGDGVGTDVPGAHGVYAVGGAPDGSAAAGSGAYCLGGGTTGSGVHGKGAASGYGVVAEGTSSSPVRTALRLVPQAAAASSPSEGDIQKTTSSRFVGYSGSAWRSLDEEKIQTMHKVTAGEVTAGYFTLSTNPINAQSVGIWTQNGLRQINKQCVGSTGATPDFDILSTNQVHINNNGAATGLSGDIIADDILIVEYVK